MSGVVAFRPAATLRRLGMDPLKSLLREFLFDDDELASGAKRLGVDMSRPGFIELGVEDVESVVVGVSFGGRPKIGPQSRDEQGQPLHSIEFSGLTIRTVAPFDWPAFLRQWKMELEEVKVQRGVCYRIKGPMKDQRILNMVYLPDDRTLVCDDEKWLRDVIGRDVPTAPAYLRGADWERASRGLLGVAIRNEDGAFAKQYDLGRSDDAVVVSLFKGIDRWVVGVEDAESIAVRAEVTGCDPDAAGVMFGAFNALVQLGRTALASTDDVPHGHQPSLRMAKAFLANLRAEPSGRSVAIRAEGFGTFGDLGSLIESEFNEAKTEAASADPKAEKR
jgi:hypothetical protein